MRERGADRHPARAAELDHLPCLDTSDIAGDDGEQTVVARNGDAVSVRQRRRGQRSDRAGCGIPGRESRASDVANQPEPAGEHHHRRLRPGEVRVPEHGIGDEVAGAGTAVAAAPFERALCCEGLRKME
jgi:hypothetical protein